MKCVLLFCFLFKTSEIQMFRKINLQMYINSAFVKYIFRIKKIKFQIETNNSIDFFLTGK